MHRPHPGAEGPDRTKDASADDVAVAASPRHGILYSLTVLSVVGVLAGLMWSFVPSLFDSEDTVTGHVVGGPWNMRSGPSAQAQKVGLIYANHPVRVVCVVEGWALLSEPVDDVYIARRGLELDEPTTRCGE
jgi:hypothetical protein